MAVRTLPVVKYKGKNYYYDDRLKQLRNVNNPHDYIDMNELSINEQVKIIEKVPMDGALYRRELEKRYSPLDPRDNEEYFPPDKYPQTRPSKKVSMKAKVKNVGESILDRAMKKIRE